MKKVCTLVAIAFLIPLITNAAPPEPEESEYIKSTGGGFSVAKGVPVYAMNFQIIKPLPQNAELRFLFENPKKGAPDITETGKLEISETEIVVQSPPLECIRNNRLYLVTIEIYAESSENRPLSIHKQKIEFRLPKQLIEQAGITIC